MEVVTILMCRAAESGLLSPIGNCTNVQRLSIYADDVVIFAKPTVSDLVTIWELLKLFGQASGLHVNYRKTLATLIRGGAQQKELIENILQCTLKDFPIRYLGLQLALRPLTKAQWQPLLDAVVHIVPAWQKGLIAKPGRLTLVKAVMAARPIHHLLVSEAPLWLLEEIDKSLRGFFWAAKDRANGGQCLVAWNRICKPFEYGGLGVKCLRTQGLALRVRWEWLMRTDDNRPWQGLPMAKDIEARQVFDSLVNITVGDGCRALFWRDRWIDGRAAEDFAPGLLLTVSTRARNMRTVAQALVDNRWLSDIPGTLATRGAREVIALWVAVNNIQRNVNTPDVFKWPWTSSGQYSAKSTYTMLMHGNERAQLGDAIWRSKATPKSKLFIWLAAQRRIWTSDRRARFGLQQHTSACFVCEQEEDTADHIILQCVVARETWHSCGRALGLNFQVPTVDSTLVDWWVLEREKFRPADRRCFDGLVCTTGYTLWKNRNAWCFDNANRQLSVIETPGALTMPIASSLSGP
ncbi:hypothetical protein ACQ4PT_013589 [Festuca glaucescens]